MIADYETNVVYVADVLERRFPSVHLGLKTILARHGTPLRTIPGARDVWRRDSMPIQTSDDRFVQFHYAPEYLTGKYRPPRADGDVGPTLPFIKNCVRSEIVLDGGNAVRWRDAVILTDKVFRENAGLSREAVVDALKADLAVSELIVVPPEPYDPIGHSDEMSCWVNENLVLVNAYATVGEPFRRRIHRSFRRSRLDVLELPYEPQPAVSRPRRVTG